MNSFRNKLFILFVIIAVISVFFSNTAEASWLSRAVKKIANVVFAPVILPALLLPDPIVWAIVDYNSCRIEIIWRCSSGGPDGDGAQRQNGGNGGDGNGNGGGWWSPPPPPPPHVSLGPPIIVEIPDPLRVSWTSSNADSCSASGDWSGDKSTSGSETIKGTTSFADRGKYNFYLSCSGPGGTASDSTYADVIQVPRCVFTSEPENIILPQFSTLSWNCQYCDSAYINRGIGDVNCSGTQNVRPDKITTYTLTGYGLDGNRMFQAIVGVGFVPVIKEVLPR